VARAPSPKPDRRQRIAAFREAYRLARSRDRLLPVRMFGPAAALVAVLVVVGVLVGQPVPLSLLGVVLALVVATTVLNRGARDAAFGQIEGQPGAAAAVLEALRGDWRVTQAVAITRSFDLVHRVIGRPGVVLVGEGSPARVRDLLNQEKKRVARVAPETPIYDVSVGDEEGQVALRRLQSHIMRLPRNLRARQVDGLENRMRALGATNVPIPKGPLPRGVRMPKGRFR
jgi:hypothetical protein